MYSYHLFSLSPASTAHLQPDRVSQGVTIMLKPTKSFYYTCPLFTQKQLYVGLISNLIVFPVNFLLVFLFRRARPRHKRPSRIQEALRRNGYGDIAPGAAEKGGGGLGGGKGDSTERTKSDDDMRKLVDSLEAQKVCLLHDYFSQYL